MTRSALALRATAALLALLALAWLALMLRDHDLLIQGTRQTGDIHGPADITRAESELRAAGTLNPDTAPDVVRAQMLIVHHRRADGLRILEDVLRREPDNITAWAGLLGITRGRDPAAYRRALAAVRRLDPLDAPRR